MKELREIIHNAELTKTQQTIADFVLDHSSDACFMTSTEIADRLDVSESSVIRFARSLGYTGFMDFQKNLRKEYQEQVHHISNAITVPSQRMAQINKVGISGDYLKQHFTNVISNIEEMFSNNSLHTFEDAADIIVKSKQKYITATRGDTALADYASLYLKHMVPNVISTSSACMSPVDQLLNICKEDCLLIFGFPRYSTLDHITVRMAKDAGAKIIVVTDKPSSLLAQYASVLITVPVDSNSFNNSLVAAQFTTECLLEAVSHRVRGIEKRLKKIDEYLDELGTY
ncbi:MAG: MurR/RpiR family transcriptional regulator [Dorea sp.]|jgi:DNA-binding MurR/RpiR family transcriptional regulator|nr:MurR/RpiR family transcriptional regulator [Dorea sp.]